MQQRLAAQGPPPVRQGPRVEIRVESILATYSVENSASGRTPATRVDKRLHHEGVGRRLASIFNFSTYRLMRSEQANTTCGQPVAFNLPGGHILHVDPFEVEGEELAIDLMMFEGERMIMRMPFRTVGGGMLFLLDQHHADQIYITAISLDSPILTHNRHGVDQNYAVDAPIQFSPALVPAQ
jgi:hypothetical protein